MTENNRTMWKDLGIDLEKHDMLLGVLSRMYQEVFVNQSKRAEGMEYFDFVMSEIHGLRVKELIETKNNGGKVIGSYCVFVPEEIVIAAGGTLIGLCSGADFATDEVEKYLPRNTCSLIKSALGFKLGKVCPYIEVADMIIGENTCDGKKKAYETFQSHFDNFYVMDLPQKKSSDGRQLLAAEYHRFADELQAMTGVKITRESLKSAINTVNAKRQALHRLALLRHANPAPISGLDALLINQIAFFDDPERFTQSVNNICDALEKTIEKQEGVFQTGRPRILVSGCPMAVPNWKVPAIIETAGAVIVGEESCIGERGQRNTVDTSGESIDALMDAIVDRYFQIDCAVFSPNQSRQEHIEEIFARTQAQGVIHYSLQFCQPYIMESIPVEKRLEEKGIPTLRIETDYTMEDAGQLKTRIEAFLEMLE